MKNFTGGLRVTMLYLVIFLIAEAIFSVGMWLTLRVKLFDLADKSLQGQAADLERFLRSRKDLPAAQVRTEVADRYKIEAFQDHVQIDDAAGNSIYRSHFLAEHPLPPVALGDLDRPLYENRKLGDDRFRFLDQQIEASGRVYVVRVGRPMQEESKALNDFRKYLIWFTPISLLLAATAGYWLNLRPLPEK